MFWLGAIVSLCYVPGISGAFIATQWAVLSIALPLCLWRNGPMTVLHWLGLLFIAYAAVRMPYAPIFEDAVFGFWLICIMGLSFWFGSTLSNLRGLYAGLAIGGSVSSIVAVLQYFGYTFVARVSLEPAGLYVNSVAQGMILALLVVALVSERMWLWVPALLPGLLLSQSRGAAIALVVGLLSIYVRRLWVFALLGIAGVIFLTRGLSQSDAMRMSIWSAVYYNLTWFGWGPGSSYSWVIFYNNSPLYPEYAHNDALQLAFEYGLGAVLPIGIFGFVLTRTAEREWPVLVAFACASCYSMPLWTPVASFIACTAAGCVVRSWALAWDYIPSWAI